MLEGFEVYGEANLKGYGRIDLLCDKSSVRAGTGVMVGSGICAGIECKNDFSSMTMEDINYRDSPSLNALYFASFAMGDYELSLDYIESLLTRREPILQILRRDSFAKTGIEARGKTFLEGVQAHREDREYTIKKKETLENCI